MVEFNNGNHKFHEVRRCNCQAILFSHHNTDKNAFQWDAYRPLVDRMLESASRGGGGVCLVRGGWWCLLGGGSAWSVGVCSGGWGVCGVCSWGGLPGPGGVCSGGVGLPGPGGIPACTEADPPCEQNE